MNNKLHMWLKVIMSCAGAAVTIVFHDDASTRLQQATTIVSTSSDAAGDGHGSPGIGGYTHGYYWRLGLPPGLLALLHITAWETLAAAINILVAARLSGPGVVIAASVDALPRHRHRLEEGQRRRVREYARVQTAADRHAAADEAARRPRAVVRDPRRLPPPRASGRAHHRGEARGGAAHCSSSSRTRAPYRSRWTPPRACWECRRR